MGKKWFRPWTLTEEETLFRMRSEGKTRLEISKALNRSKSAIMSRITYANRSVRPYVEPPPPPRLARETIAITRVQVPEYYELGWRFVGFDGPLCKFEWRSEREPRWPEQMREAA